MGFWVLGGVLCGFSSVAVQAQVAAAPSGAASQPAAEKTTDKNPRTAQATTTASAQAMERAQRQAANPMRVILEAAKIQRRPVETLVSQAQPARRATAVLPAATATAAALAVRAVSSAPSVPSASTVPLALPTESTAAGPAGAGTTSSPAVGLMSSELAAATVPPASAAITKGPQAAGVGVALPLAPKLDNLPAPEASPKPVPAAQVPKVLTLVEPAITARQWDDLRGSLVLETDISLRADGSVEAVSFVSLAPRAVLRVVQEAVERWRFEPPDEPQTYRIQLVLNPPPR